MQAINAKDMRTDEFSSLTVRSIRHARSVQRNTFLLSSFLGLTLLLACSVGCAPSSSQSDGRQDSSKSGTSEIPEITEESIYERINDAGLREVAEENGAAEPISWNFDENEPKEIVIVEKHMEGGRATIILDIKTSSSPRAREPRYLAGHIRTEWELRTGWVLRQWEIANTENISMKYRNLPKPPGQNSNR